MGDDRARCEARDGFENLVGGLRPLEGLRGFVMGVEVFVDCFTELESAFVRPATKCVLRQETQEALDEVQPRGVRRSEMEVEAGGLHQPTLVWSRAFDARADRGP